MSYSDTEEVISDGSVTDDEDVEMEEEEEAEEEEEEEITPPKKKGRPAAKPKSVKVKSKKIVKRKTPVKKNVPAPKIVKKNEDVVIDISDPDKQEVLMTPFCCKIGGDWAIKVQQYSSHGTPFLQIQNIDDKLAKKFGIQLPMDRANKLIKGVMEALKHCTKNK